MFYESLGTGLAAELRRRERILGVTADARRDLRIKLFADDHTEKRLLAALPLRHYGTLGATCWTYCATASATAPAAQPSIGVARVLRNGWD